MDRAGRRAVGLGPDPDGGRVADPRRLRGPGPDRPGAQGPRAHRPAPDPGRARGLRPPALTTMGRVADPPLRVRPAEPGINVGNGPSAYLRVSAKGSVRTLMPGGWEPGDSHKD